MSLHFQRTGCTHAHWHWISRSDRGRTKHVITQTPGLPLPRGRDGMGEGKEIVAPRCSYRSAFVCIFTLLYELIGFNRSGSWFCPHSGSWFCPCFFFSRSWRVLFSLAHMLLSPCGTEDAAISHPPPSGETQMGIDTTSKSLPDNFTLPSV